ncbi:hypothetical protein [Thermococcus barossii]|uniref:Uncharacterized protein n=1 Tax=Thermococcus barossii TaxID=54077 RepID=A0A2Z2MJA3_9EURY|nr:hypothetical protein [Thermococcus barossii]ASJ04842.1 hypothetical protein A3L01_05485 [Thermococcus barossii]
MQRHIVWLIALLVFGAMMQGASAANYRNQPEIHTYQVSVNGQMITITMKNGMVSIPDTPGMDRKAVFEAVNRYFSSQKEDPISIKAGLVTPSGSWAGSDDDYRFRKAFTLPSGDVYISSYTSITATWFSSQEVSVSGYSSGASWLEPYDYWWSISYTSKSITLGISVKFVGISVSVSAPPGFSIGGDSGTTTITISDSHRDYLGYRYSGVEGLSFFGITRVEGHTHSSFLFYDTQDGEGIQSNAYVFRP